MGGTKRIKNKIKWHIQKEKYLKQEETKEEHIIKLKKQQFTTVQIVGMQWRIIEFVKNAVITEEKLL